MLKGTIVAGLSALALMGAAYADTAADTTAVATNGTTAQTQKVHKKAHKHHKKAHKKAAAVKADAQVANTNQNMMDSVAKYVNFNSDISDKLLNRFDGVNRELGLLNERAQGHVAKGLTLGGSLQADAFWQGTAVNDNFLNPAISAAADDNTASHVQFNRVNLQFLAAFNDWATLNATYDRNLVNADWHKAYLLLGNLNSSPFYGLIGRNDIDFGQFASVSPYTMPLNRLAFQANGEVVEVGAATHGFNVGLSAMNGGAQTASVDQTSVALPQNLSTPNSNSINNVALNTGYDVALQGGSKLHVGGGLLRGSAYQSVASNPSAANPAWDLNGSFEWNGLKLLAELTRTFNELATVFGGKDEAAWQVAAQYGFMALNHASVASIDYSAVNEPAALNALGSLTNNTGSPGIYASAASQYVLGLRTEIVKHVTTGAEYAYDTGGYNHNNTLLFDVTAIF